MLSRASISILYIALAGVGCGSSTAESANTAPVAERCIVLQNGNKLCGADAKAWCRAFQPSDPASRAACDLVLGRPPRLSGDDFASADECWKELGVERCSQWFSTPEQLKRAEAEDVFAARLEQALGEELVLEAMLSNVSLEGSHAYLESDTDADATALPPPALRKKICARVLAMPEVESASWEPADGSRSVACGGR